MRFDPAFGAGQPDWMGDEYIFLCDALRAGLRGWHVDVTPASHPAESSGLRQSPEAMAVRRRVLIRALGRGAALRCGWPLPGGTAGRWMAGAAGWPSCAPERPRRRLAAQGHRGYGRAQSLLRRSPAEDEDRPAPPDPVQPLSEHAPCALDPPAAGGMMWLFTLLATAEPVLAREMARRIIRQDQFHRAARRASFYARRSWMRLHLSRDMIYVFCNQMTLPELAALRRFLERRAPAHPAGLVACDLAYVSGMAVLEEAAADPAPKTPPCRPRWSSSARMPTACWRRSA
ncbi:hypothetical protein ACFSHQ_27560 [Gemmobacter lanyuensis]